MSVRGASSALLLVFAAATLGAPGTASAGGCYGHECYRRVVTPPVFDTLAQQHLVSPPRTIYRTRPPLYDTISEQVLVAPAGRHWETRYDAHGQLVGCWVTTPPRYAVTSRRVLVRGAEVIPETLPPVYRTSVRRVLVQPAHAAWVPVDAGYGVGSLPDAFGITGASSADVAVGLGFSHGSIYDGY